MERNLEAGEDDVKVDIKIDDADVAVGMSKTSDGKELEELPGETR